MIDQAKLPKMSQNGRNVGELQREDLEQLIIELDAEMISRTKRITELRSILTTVNSSVKRTETAAQDQILDYIIAPSCLKADYAKNYAGKEALESINNEPLTHQNGELYARKEARITGAYNPYSGANRRIVALRQKIGEMQQKIVDVNEDKEKLLKEKQRLKDLLEQNPHADIKNSPFIHEKPIPKSMNKKKNNVTKKQCLNALDKLLEQEKDQYRNDCLRCVGLILTGEDREALELFARLFEPGLSENSIKELEDLLSDRNAQVAILREQFNHLDSKQNALRNAFLTLKDKMANHNIGFESDIDELRVRVLELEQMIKEIPVVESEIRELRERRRQLLDEKDEIFRKGSDEASRRYAELKQKRDDLADDKSGYDRERIQLEERDQRLREQYNTIVEECKRLRANESDVKEQLNKIETEKRKIHANLTLLARAGITDPSQVMDIANFCNGSTPTEIEIDRSRYDDEFKTRKDSYLSLKKECKQLEKILQNKNAQEQALRERVQQARIARNNT